MLDKWFSLPEVYDNKLDTEYLRQQLEIRTKKQLFINYKAQPYFSPSSANSCLRELYVKTLGGKKDVDVRPPYQGRWQKIGTSLGDMLQRELLFIDKHYESKLGKRPAFVPDYTNEGYPMWEDFVKAFKIVTHNGATFALNGKPDGILIHTPTGRRIGLEIKSKQTTAAQTSLYSMKEPKQDHVKQVVTYSIMYDVDEYLIVYINASKKGWVISDGDYAKNPDIRAFHVNVTESDRQALLDTFAEVVKAVETKTPPPLDLDKWTFNNFKTACALSLSDDEFNEIKTKVQAVKKSRLPDWKKQAYYEALRFIENVRGSSN